LKTFSFKEFHQNEILISFKKSLSCPVRLKQKLPALELAVFGCCKTAKAADVQSKTVDDDGLV